MRRRFRARGAVGESVLTEPAYRRSGGELACEGVSLTGIAASVGTPVYVYSAGSIRERVTRLRDALAGLPVRVHYSVKANSNLAILALVRASGLGVDIVSGGELHRALAAGFAGGDIVFSGVGKTESEIERALLTGVHSINIENPAELDLVQLVGARLGVVAPVVIRVNPDVEADTPHPYTRTGEHGMKFGIPQDQVVPIARRASTLRNVRLLGLAAHVGSQISDALPFVMAARELDVLAAEIESDGVTKLTVFDLGGGLGVPYEEGDREPDLGAFADALRPLAVRSGVTILIEPGRYIVAESGVLVTRVLYRKHSGGKEIVITDAAMNDMVRPALYASYHRIEAVGDAAGSTVVANVVGPICESGDFLAIGREIPDVHPGDLLAVRTAGAYGSSMASNYNSRPRPAEVLVDGDRWALIARREVDDELIRRETATPAWRDE